MDLIKIEDGVRLILEGIGEDSGREGLVETPKRVAKMYKDLLSNTGRSNEDIAKEFGKCFTEEKSRDIVIVRDIPIFSFCEHHMALMYDMKVTVGYIPEGKVIGLSKIARIADAVGKRLQLQERIGKDILEIMRMATGCENIFVAIEAKHSCVTARGIQKDAVTRTLCMSGENIAHYAQAYA